MTRKFAKFEEAYKDCIQKAVLGYMRGTLNCIE